MTCAATAAKGKEIKSDHRRLKAFFYEVQFILFKAPPGGAQVAETLEAIDPPHGAVRKG